MSGILENIRKEVRKSLNNLVEEDDPVQLFAERVLLNWVKLDGARGGKASEEICTTLRPILSDVGLDNDSFDNLWLKIQNICGTACDTATQRTWEVSEAIVPIENPVQMNLSALSKAMSSGSKTVRLDWLATRRIVASQVDKEKLHKIVSRHQQRAEKRGARVLSGSQNFLIPDSSRQDSHMGKNQEQQIWNPQLIVDEILSGEDSNSGQKSSRDLHLESFDVALAGKRILTGASVTIAHGRRYGLVGRNGVGKSTFLRAIASRQLPVPPKMSILHVEQEVTGDETSAIQSVLSADFRREALLFEEKRLTNELSNLSDESEKVSFPGSGTGANGGKIGATSASTREMTHRLQAIYKALVEMDAASAEASASHILAGLGFSPEAQLRPTSSFSGGWRMRIALARALFCKPDMLLLDEPTNMLDFPSVVWLEGYLNAWNGTLLVVSHDRCFLDNVATDILHMHNEIIDIYKGNYAQFVATRDERTKNAQREYDAQLQYRQHLQAFVDRWRYNAGRAAQAQSRLKILERLPELKPVVAEAPVVLRFMPADSILPPLLQLSGVSFRYSETSSLILQDVDFNVQPASRIAVVGPNGAGKSTLLKLLSGSLEPTTGQLYRHGRLRIALFTQHHVEQLDLSLNSLQMVQARFPGKSVEEYRQALGSFGLSGPLALQITGTLSGGQKSRLVFTLLAMEKPHIMILDEPTNHLDMDTIDALMDALRDYSGGILVVSHDKRFVESVCSEIWVCDNSRLQRFDGTIHDYANSLLASRV